MSGVSASATPTQDGSNNTVPKNENGEGASNTASKIGNVKQAGLLHHAQSTQYDWNDLLGTDIVPPSGKKGPKKQKGNASSSALSAASAANHEYYEGGSFTFRSGIVCLEDEPEILDVVRIIVHLNVDTDEIILPQSACNWVRDLASSDSSPARSLESFDRTAKRIAENQTAESVSLVGFHGNSSTQPGSLFSDPHRCQFHSHMFVKAPFLMDTFTNKAGNCKVTAWFLAEWIDCDCAELEDMDDDEPPPVPKIDTAGLGEDWKPVKIDVKQALKRLSKHEAQVVEKGRLARAGIDKEMVRMHPRPNPFRQTAADYGYTTASADGGSPHELPI